MAELPKLPSQYLKRSQTVKDMTVGTRAELALDAMRIDLEHHGWIDPTAEPFKPPSPLSAYLSVERVEGGFRVFLEDAQPDRWTTEAKPDPEKSQGLEWYPVVEFVGRG